MFKTAIVMYRHVQVIECLFDLRKVSFADHSPTLKQVCCWVFHQRPHKERIQVTQHTFCQVKILDKHMRSRRQLFSYHM